MSQSGFNDQEFVLPGRLPHSDALYIIERFRRRDFGHLETQYTIEDPKVYTKPWTFKKDHHLLPDTELLEYICDENEKDLKHMVGWTNNQADSNDSPLGLDRNRLRDHTTRAMAQLSVDWHSALAGRQAQPLGATPRSPDGKPRARALLKT